MAEFLVRVKKHWMDDISQSEIDAMTVDERRNFDSRTQIGDIIVVRPDGWVWGNEECLPTFLVVKVVGINVADVAKFEEPLNEIYMENIDGEDVAMNRLLKRRKYQIPVAWVENKAQQGDSVVIVSVNAQKVALINSVIEKV